jgi:hypothetical protein
MDCAGDGAKRTDLFVEADQILTELLETLKPGDFFVELCELPLGCRSAGTGPKIATSHPSDIVHDQCSSCIMLS